MSLSLQEINEAIEELHTAQDMWRWASSQFQRAELHFGHGTVCAWDEAGALVTQTLDIPHHYIREIAACTLTRRERELIARRAAQRINDRRPLPYITGKALFCGLEFVVDERVLIPRSPMAELIEKQFQPWLGEAAPARILDLCCGSACIAIACAHAFPDAEVDASDISPEALSVAARNVQRLDDLGQVQLIESDGLKGLADQKYDLIVCNPPYVDARDMAELPPEYRHEPRLALASGDDGLDFVRDLLHHAADHLNEGGLLFCEVGNSWVTLADAYPDVPFTWLHFEHSEDGVFMLCKDDLLRYFPVL